MPKTLDPQTADKLIAAAEIAFAEAGIAGASVRRINELAGQRNTSAIQYYFGNKDGLLEALIERRMGALEAQRALALAALDAECVEPSTDQLVAVLVAPLAEAVCREPAWGCWVRVLAQLVSIRGRQQQALWRSEHDQTSRLIFRRLRGSLRELPEPVWRQRSADLMVWVTASLCERAGLQEAGIRPPLGRQAFVENLVRTTSRALTA